SKLLSAYLLFTVCRCSHIYNAQPTIPEDFELYGCYCGQEGRGQPTDDLDKEKERDGIDRCLSY
uniref:Uncharacterized protein n=1 Tax=Salvator merianae TaxID=96440 RepID=A0A8D0BAA8_SALMN